MLRRSCEVHVTHKTTAPFRDWNIEELAPKHCLSSMYPVNLKKEDYPGYNNKRGAGLKCHEPFPLGEGSTFIFGFYRARKRVMSYVGFLTKDISRFKRFQSKCRRMELHLTRDMLMQSQPLVRMNFQPLRSLMAAAWVTLFVNILGLTVSYILEQVSLEI